MLQEKKAERNVTREESWRKCSKGRRLEEIIQGKKAGGNVTTHLSEISPSLNFDYQKNNQWGINLQGLRYHQI